MKGSPIRWIVRVFVLFALLYLGVCGYFWTAQRSFIFEPEAALQTTPDRDGLKFEPVRIPSGSGTERAELFGWWIPAEQADAPTLLYLHGNFRNVSYNVEHAMRLHRLGVNVLLVDYRGYGQSGGGMPSESKVYEDAESAWNYVSSKGIPPKRIIIYGHSLGGAIAIDLASRHPEAAGLITESTFSSMQAMGELNYGFLPIGFLLNQRFDSIQKIGQIKIPVLLLHGTWDKKIPYGMAQQLYERAPQPKTLKLIEGGEHSNSSGIAWVEYSTAVASFIKQAILQ